MIAIKEERVMYHVVKMYGDCEPWWFLEGWEEDIVTDKEFEHYEEALSYYQREWVYLSEEFSQWKNKSGMMTAFWDPEDQVWCEECDEYLQQYHSLMLMEGNEQLPQGLRNKRVEPRVRPCRIKN